MQEAMKLAFMTEQSPRIAELLADQMAQTDIMEFWAGVCDFLVALSQASGCESERMFYTRVREVVAERGRRGAKFTGTWHYPDNVGRTTPV